MHQLLKPMLFFFFLSQEINLPDKDKYATTISEANNFDLSVKIFPLIFTSLDLVYILMSTIFPYKTMI